MTLLQVRMRMKEHVTLYFDLGFIQCKYLHFWLLLFTVRVNLFSLHTDIKFTSRPTRNITFTCMVSSSRSVLPSLVTLQQILSRNRLRNVQNLCLTMYWPYRVRSRLFQGFYYVNWLRWWNLWKTVYVFLFHFRNAFFWKPTNFPSRSSMIFKQKPEQCRFFFYFNVKKLRLFISLLRLIIS